MEPDVVPRGPGRAEGPHLSVAAVARMLGIAPATLRTWDRRYGIGPSAHTPGTHRRYSPEDVARLETMRQALVRGVGPADAAAYAMATAGGPPAVDGGDRSGAYGDGAVFGVARLGERSGAASVAGPLGEPSGVVAGRVRSGQRSGVVSEVAPPRGPGTMRLQAASPYARGLGRAALALDFTAARTVLAEAIAVVGVVGAWDDVARPVLAAVARRWSTTGAGVEVEHLLSHSVFAVFSAHVAARDAGPGGRTVLLAGMPQEQHMLPLVVLGAALGDHGVPMRPLGGDLPAEALVAAVRRTAPAAVVLWSLLPETADVAVLEALPETRPRARTFAAGPGWADASLPGRAQRLSSLVEAVDALVAATR